MFGLLATLFLPMGSFAQTVEELFIWQPQGPAGQRLVMARLDTESRGQAIERYQNAFEQNRELRALTGGHLFLPRGLLGEIPVVNENGFVAIANDVAHMTSLQDGLEYTRELRRSKADTFMLPVAASVGLSEAQELQYFERVVRTFPSFLGLGGEDFSPRLYHEREEGARGSNESRDWFELRLYEFLYRAAVANGRTSIFVICRASQAFAVSRRLTLIQDLRAERPMFRIRHSTNDPDKVNEHAVHLVKSAFRDYLGRAIVMFSSYHHEAVDLAPGKVPQDSGIRPIGFDRSPLDPLAVLEVYEIVDPKGTIMGYGFQGHPELMVEPDDVIRVRPEDGRAIMDFIVRHGCNRALSRS